MGSRPAGRVEASPTRWRMCGRWQTSSGSTAFRRLRRFGGWAARVRVRGVSAGPDQRTRARVALDPTRVLEGFDLSDADKAQLEWPELQQIIRESALENCANGVGGWVDDDLAVIKPWGFDVSQISVPVLVCYGSSDVLVPAAHGAWLAANIPGCAVLIDDCGHLGADPVGEISAKRTLAP